MEAKDIHQLLVNRFHDRIKGFQENTFPNAVVVDGSSIVEVCGFLKNEPGMEFTSLISISGVDLKEQSKLMVAYHLGSMQHKHKIVLKVETDRNNPHVPTIEMLWRGANWYEREAYDLFGIIFDGNSDLRRILLPDDWEGYPMRKDYVYPKRYHTWNV